MYEQWIIIRIEYDGTPDDTLIPWHIIYYMIIYHIKIYTYLQDLYSKDIVKLLQADPSSV